MYDPLQSPLAAAIGAGAAAYAVANTCQFLKPYVYRWLINPNGGQQGWYFRGVVFLVSLGYVFGTALCLNLLTRAAVPSLYGISIGVCLLAIAGYHLQQDDPKPAAQQAASRRAGGAAAAPNRTADEDRIARWRRDHEDELAALAGRRAVPVKRPAQGGPATEEDGTQVQPVVGAEHAEKGVVRGGGRAAAAGPGQTRTEDDASHRGDEAWLAAAAAAVRWQERNRARGYVEGPQPEPAPDPEVPWAHGQHVSELGDGS